MKKVIIAFILGLFLAAGVSVYAYSYLAKNIKYTKVDGTISNVEDALNELSNSSEVYEKGSFSIYVPGTSYAYANLNFKKNYVESDNAYISINKISGLEAPLYFYYGISGKKIIGNSLKFPIVNYAGNNAYSDTFLFEYIIFRRD